ncbi:MAG: sortase [Chloroflexota bacterium]
MISEPSGGLAAPPTGSPPAPPSVRSRLRAGAATLLLVGGLGVMLAGSGALLLRWYAAESWAASDEAAQAERQLAAPAPRWIDPSEPLPTPRPTQTPRSAPRADPPSARAPGAALAAPSSVPDSAAATDQTAAARPPDDRQASGLAADGAPAPSGPTAPLDSPRRPALGPPADDRASAMLGSGPDPTPAPPPTPTPEPRAPASAIRLVESGFRFLDPPEPGAQAQVSLRVTNQSPLPTGPLRMTLSPKWLKGWRVVDAEPPVLDDRVLDETHRAFDFPGLDGGSEGTLLLHLVATDDAVDPPQIGLSLLVSESASGPDRDGGSPDAAREIAQTRPQTVAPRPHPGPARAVEIPRLKLHAAVVPTVWEPPGWVVGQLKSSANLSEGNTVLIGHLTGLAGNVFARLQELEPGDEIIATSRGLEYRFVVSETMVLPNDDSLPAEPSDTARLTLMTCTGEWDPLHHDYSHRLWVVAEPPELAESTLSGETLGPLSRQLGRVPSTSEAATAPTPNVEAARIQGAMSRAVVVAPTPTPAPPAAEIVAPSNGAQVPSRVMVRGRRARSANPAEPLWLAVRAEIEGSRWYLYGQPLDVHPDGSWEASLEIGGGPGIRHTIVVAPVDAATDARLRRQVAQRPGEPLAILPDAFEAGARVTVERR